jgi:hypothetical protein
MRLFLFFSIGLTRFDSFVKVSVEIVEAIIQSGQANFLTLFFPSVIEVLKVLLQPYKMDPQSERYLFELKIKGIDLVIILIT